MVRIDQTEDGLVLCAGPIRLAFLFDGQRWSHELSAAGCLTASSVEWLPERDAPTRVVSPAYQQVLPQSNEDGQQALLLGQWGHHHFSGVFTVQGDWGGVSITADVALRTRAEVQSFGATYLMPIGSAHSLEAGSGGLVWPIHDLCRGRIAFEATQPVLAEAGRSGTYVQALASLKPEQATHRLAYRWRWLADNV